MSRPDPLTENTLAREVGRAARLGVADQVGLPGVGTDLPPSGGTGASGATSVASGGDRRPPSSSAGASSGAATRRSTAVSRGRASTGAGFRLRRASAGRATPHPPQATKTSAIFAAGPCAFLVVILHVSVWPARKSTGNAAGNARAGGRLRAAAALRCEPSTTAVDARRVSWRPRRMGHGVGPAAIQRGAAGAGRAGRSRTAPSWPPSCCGSLSHDRVWAKSDIDLLLVTIDDKKIEERRPGALRRRGQRARLPPAAGEVPRPSSRGPCATPSCTPCWPRGGCSTPTTRASPSSCASSAPSASATPRCSCWHAATEALAHLYKAHKWLITRGDLEYTSPLHPPRRHAAGQAGGDRRPPHRRPGGDPPGLPAQPRPVQGHLPRPAQQQEDAPARCKAALDAVDRYLAERAAAAVRAAARSPAARWARPARPPSSRTTSRATSASRG